MIVISGKGRQRRTTAAGTVLLAVFFVCVSCRRTPTVLVSDPPGATVWLEERIIGRTPVDVPPDLVEPVTLRFSLPGCEDAFVSFDPRVTPPEGRVRVTLQRPTDLALLCESTPSGADVYVDGEFHGRTPLQLRHLEPRPVELVFRMSNRQTVARTVDPTTRADSVLTVELPSKTEAYYRQQIAQESANIHHYADLAHHYILEGRVDDAMTVFAEAVTVLVKTPGIRDATRLWSEIQRVTDKQYDYGDENDVAAARTALRDTLADLLKTYPNAPFPYLHVNYILVLDRLNQRQQAQEAFERAWRRFPNDKLLQRLRRQGFAAP